MRWFYRFAVIAVVAAVVVAGALFLLPSERIARIAESRFEEMTGRAVTLSGGVSATIYPSLGVKIGGVEVANADWSESGPMLTAEEARVGVDLMALIGGTVKITEVEVIDPTLRLEVAQDGRANWSSGATTAPDTAAAAGADEGSIRSFSLDRGVLRNGTASYVDRATGQSLEITNLDLDLSLPSFEGPATVNGAANLAGQVQSFSAEIGSFSAFAEGGISDLLVTAESGETTLSFDGRGGFSPVALEGNIDVAVEEPAQFFSMLGQQVDLPDGLGRGSIALDGAVTLTQDETFHLRNGTLRLDQNTIAVDLDTDLSGEQPQIDARLSADALDFSALGSGSGGSGGDGSSANAGGWPRDAIDASGLSTVNGRVQLVANSIDTGSVRVGPADILATLDRSRLQIDLRQLSAYGGNITGNFAINNRSGLSVGGDLRFADLALQSLLSDFADYDRLSGTGSMSLQFLGSGSSVDAIMKSLSGSGSLSFGAGEIRGLDLVGMLRNLDASFEGAGAKTVYDSITASFAINNGVLTNDDLNFRAPLATATGSGRVGIGEQTIDYRVVPVALPGQDGSGGISVPVLITGPWANPSFRPDLEFLLKQEFDEERRAAEERVREKVEEKLGVNREEGESAEDAVKRRLEEEVGNKLLDLLGGN